MSRLLLALLILLSLLGGAGCRKTETLAAAKPADEHGHAEGGHEEAGHDEGGAAGGDVELNAEGVEAAGIVVRAVQSGPVRAEVRVPGVVASTPSGRAVVTPPVEGRVLRLLVSVGQTVRRGQPLAVIESAPLAERAVAVSEAGRGVAAAQAEVARLSSELKLAQGRARSAESALKRQRELARTGAFSQPTLQAAERELVNARADLESAQKEAVVHRTQLERSERLYKQELVSKIEVENARLDVEKDRIAQERAAKAIEISRAVYERERRIGRRGLLNAREIGAAEADVRAARLEVERGRIALRSAQTAVGGARGAVQGARAAYAALKGSGNLAQGGRLTLAAPIGGTVVHREVNAGAALERTTELFEIDDLREVYVTAQVPEREVVGLSQGAAVTVTTSAHPNRRFVGRIETIGSRLDPKTRTLPVQCLVPNADGALRPEMFAEVALGKGGERSALAIPSSAVFKDGGESHVYVEEAPGRYGRKTVALGAASGTDVEIVGGLERGERIVTEGIFTLRSEAQKAGLKGHEH